MTYMDISYRDSNLSILNMGKYRRFSGSLIMHLRLQSYFFSIFMKLALLKFLPFLIFFLIRLGSTLIFALIFSLFISFVPLTLCCSSLNSIARAIAYFFHIFHPAILFFFISVPMLLWLFSIFLLLLVFCSLSWSLPLSVYGGNRGQLHSSSVLFSLLII